MEAYILKTFYQHLTRPLVTITTHPMSSQATKPLLLLSKRLIISGNYTYSAFKILIKNSPNILSHKSYTFCLTNSFQAIHFLKFLNYNINLQHCKQYIMLNQYLKKVVRSKKVTFSSFSV